MNVINLKKMRQNISEKHNPINSLSFLFEKNRNIGELYVLEKAILQRPQNEFSEEAAQGVRSLIRYYKSL